MKSFKLLVFMMFCFLILGIMNVSAAEPGVLKVNNTTIDTATETTTNVGGGTAKYNPATQTLTLDNVSGSKNIGVDAGSGINLTIEIVNNNTLGRIVTVGNLTIIGSGKLTINIEPYSDAILSDGTTTIKNVTLDLKAAGGIGINSEGDLLIENANISSEGTNAAIRSNQSIGINNSVIDALATLDERNAIVANGELSIKDSDITAKSYYPALWSQNPIEVKNSKLNLESTNDISIFSVSRDITIFDTELNLIETQDFRNFATTSYITNADYSEVDQLLEEVPKDLTKYTEESVTNLETIISSIDRTLTNQNQDQVDEYVIELSKGLENLELKGETPGETPEEKPVDKPTEKPEEKPVDKPTEKPEENPQTFDGIDNFVISGIISLIGFIGSGLYIVKKRFN